MPLPEPVSKLVDSGQAHVQEPYVSKPRRKMFRRLPCYVPGYAPICNDTNDPATQIAGLKKRLLRDIPEPDPVFLKEFGDFVKTWLNENISPVSTRLSFDEWIGDTPYTEERRNELREVYDLSHGGLPSPSAASKIKSFGKTESYPTYKYLRWINSRPDCVKVWFGPLMKQVERVLFARPEFIKHTPVQDRPAALASIMSAVARYFLTDFTAFESHFLPQMMKVCECQLYRHVLQNVCEAAELDRIEQTLTGKNRMKTRLGVSAECDGRRQSGEMCTSVGNGFQNLMLALFLASRKGLRIRGFVEGDDGIFAVEGGVLEEQDYLRIGWTIKLQEVSSPCEMIPLDAEPGAFGVSCGAFCGILCSEDGQIIRDPRSFLSTFGWTSSFINAGDRIMNELQRAKALSAVFETPDCPIVSVMARHALEVTQGYAPRFVSDGYHELPRDEMKVKPFNPTTRTRLLFETQFGVSVADQLKIESCLERGNVDSILSMLGSTADMLHYEARFVEAD